VRIRAERDDLADVLTRAGRAVGARAALPILQGLLLEATGSALKVTGTDLEMTVKTRTEVEVMEEGRVVIPAKLAGNVVSKMPEGAVTVSSEEGEVVIEGRGPRFSLRELPADDFPQVADADLGDVTSVDGDEFAAAVAQVVVAASTDAARPILTGVLVEQEDDSVRLVATDSYRLAVRDVPGVRIGGSGLVPARGLRDLARTVGGAKVQVGIQEREAVFGSDRGAMTLRLIEGKFPSYRQLIPESYPNVLRLAKDDLLEALGRAALVAEDHIPVRLSMGEGGVELTVTRQDVGGETEHVAGEFSGEDVMIAFNPRYLAEGVSAIENDHVELHVIDSHKPSVIRGVGEELFTYLLMPVRV